MLSLMSAVVRYCRNSLVRFVYCIAKSMRNISSYIVGYEHSVRSLLGVFARTISIRPLSKTETATTFKTFQQIFVVTDQTIKIFLKNVL